jgi:hypothetical protein
MCMMRGCKAAMPPCHHASLRCCRSQWWAAACFEDAGVVPLLMGDACPSTVRRSLVVLPLVVESGEWALEATDITCIGAVVLRRLLVAARQCDVVTPDDRRGVDVLAFLSRRGFGGGGARAAVVGKRVRRCGTRIHGHAAVCV